MAINFPTSLDVFTDPTASDQLNLPSHSGQHTDLNNAVEALEAKVGINSSAVTSSHDYKIAQLEARTEGKILQVVHSSYATQISSSSSAYVDTGLSVTITPTAADSEILLMISQNGIAKTAQNSNLSIDIKLFRDATDLGLIGDQILNTASSLRLTLTSHSHFYLDSPATTSAVTYKTQFSNNANTAQAYVQFSDAISTIVALEVSA